MLDLSRPAYAARAPKSSVMPKETIVSPRCDISSACAGILQMYIPQPVKVNLQEGMIEKHGGLRKMTVVFMELLDLTIAVSDDKDALYEVCVYEKRLLSLGWTADPVDVSALVSSIDMLDS